CPALGEDRQRSGLALDTVGDRNSSCRGIVVGDVGNNFVEVLLRIAVKGDRIAPHLAALRALSRLRKSAKTCVAGRIRPCSMLRLASARMLSRARVSWVFS